MFDIKIGTILDCCAAVKAIPILNKAGFECYEVTTGQHVAEPKLRELASQYKDVLDGRCISSLAFYANPLENEKDVEYFKTLIKSCKYFNCNTIGCFSGSVKGMTPEEMMPVFKKTFEPIVKLAEDEGVKIGFENCSCGGTWYKNVNLAFTPAAWEMMFNEINSPNLGLEWEPCHMLNLLIDPIANLRKFAKKVVHVHGKDATVAWDVIREYGLYSPYTISWDRTPGFGDTNWADVFTILLQNGFEGACDIEGHHDPVHYDDMEWTAQKTALDYLKRCRGGIEHFEGPYEFIKGFQGPRKR